MTLSHSPGGQQMLHKIKIFEISMSDSATVDILLYLRSTDGP